MPLGEDAEGRPGWKLPDAYADTAMTTLLRAAERFGRDPVTWVDGLSPGWRRLLAQYERLRWAEDQAVVRVLIEAATAARLAG